MKNLVADNSCSILWFSNKDFCPTGQVAIIRECMLFISQAAASEKKINITYFRLQFATVVDPWVRQYGGEWTFYWIRRCKEVYYSVLLLTLLRWSLSYLLDPRMNRRTHHPHTLSNSRFQNTRFFCYYVCPSFIQPPYAWHHDNFGHFNFDLFDMMSSNLHKQQHKIDRISTENESLGDYFLFIERENNDYVSNFIGFFIQPQVLFLFIRKLIMTTFKQEHSNFVGSQTKKSRRPKCHNRNFVC